MSRAQTPGVQPRIGRDEGTTKFSKVTKKRTILTLMARSLSPAFASILRPRCPRFRNRVALDICCVQGKSLISTLEKGDVYSGDLPIRPASQRAADLSAAHVSEERLLRPSWPCRAYVAHRLRLHRHRHSS